MKQFIIFSLLLCILQNKFLLAQEGVTFGYKEIYTFTENVNSNDTIYFNLQAAGNVWAWDESPPYEIATTYNGHSILENGLIVIGNYSEPWKGWENLISGGPHTPPYYSHGLYKFSVKKNYNGSIIYFYINFRDSDWDGSSYPCGNDIYFYYNGSNNSLRIRWCGGDTTTKSVSNGQVSNFWTEKGKTNVSTNKFSNFWSNCLVLIPSEIANHPRLIWGPHPTFTSTHYKIYRAGGDNPPINQYVLRATVSNNVFEWVDETVTIGGVDRMNYLVRAFNSETIQLSEPSNAVTSNVRFLEKGNGRITYCNGLNLFQNYPNPFNPVTKIKFTIGDFDSPSADRFTTLKIFDILGREVATLVNEPKPPGEYEVTFSAKGGYASGLYLYQLKSGSFIETKKFVLMK